MKNIIIFFIPLLLVGCNSVEPEMNYREAAQGFWQATEGDINVENQIGLITYNWYSINTSKDENKVFVIWDDGLICTETEAELSSNRITMTVYDINCCFTIIDKKILKLNLPHLIINTQSIWKRSVMIQ